MKINIDLSTTEENNEYGELGVALAEFREVSEKFNMLVKQRVDIATRINRITRSAIDRNKLSDLIPRDIDLPPFIANGQVNYAMEGKKLSIELGDNVVNIVNG